MTKIEAMTQKNKTTAVPQQNSWQPFLIGCFIVFICFLAYFNTLQGHFIYDDTKQILENPLIIQPSQLSQALTSDVWAFKGDPANPASNYWRPTFILWLALNGRLFGLADSTGWHITNILLHAGVCLLAYAVLRRLKLPPILALLLVALFAVHPVHVESVAWISGVTDVLLAFFLLLSTWFLLFALDNNAKGAREAAALAYIAALLTKESSILFAFFVFVLVFSHPTSTPSNRWSRSFKAAAPFAVLAVLYFFIRLNILGQFQVSVPWAAGPVEMVLTAPSLMAFYLRQCLFPLWLGPSYPLRVVTGESLTLVNFWGPLLVLAIAGGLLFYGRKNRLVQIGFCLFTLFLIPAFNINAYLPEQIVHDRYLYLPLLGFLLMLYGLYETWANSPAKSAEKSSSRPLTTQYTLLALLAVPLLYQTVQYNTAWLSELALWQWGIQSDPTSAFNQTQYAVALIAEERYSEARDILNKVLAVSAVTDAYLARGEAATALGDLNQAAADLNVVLAAYPNDPRAYERLAVVYQKAGQINEAIAVLQAGREKVSYRACAFTSNLGVAYYIAGQKQTALAELEKIPTLLGTGADYTTTCQLGLFHLAQLYTEIGNTTGAKAALNQFLQVTAVNPDEKLTRFRQQAQQQLESLP